MKRLLLSSFVISAAAGLSWGQASGEKHVQRLNRAPVSQDVLRVQLPRPVEKKLPNGLTVLVLERHKLPTVVYSLWVKTGALSDPKDGPGLASAAAAMLKEGTASRTSAQLAAEVDALGASLDAGADFRSGLTKVGASGLAENADALMGLMADIVLHPTFPQDELEKFKTRLLAGLEQQRSNPGFLAQERFMRALYREHPAAVISATTESAKALTSDKLRSWYDNAFIPPNAVLGVAGDVKPEEAFELVQKHFGAWKTRTAFGMKVPAVPAAPVRKVYVVDRPGSVQTVVRAGNFSLTRKDPDFIPLTVMNRVLGEGPSARLFLDLREEKGYTYGVYSNFGADVYTGAWSAGMEVRNAVTSDSLRDLMAQFKRIRDEAVPADELAEARRAIVARFALSLESPSSLLDAWLAVNYYGLPQDYWDRYPEEVMKVTPDIVKKMAAKYVDLDHLQLVCVGDAKAIKDAVKTYGDVDVYDADGRRLP